MAVSHMLDQIGRVLSGRYRLVAPIGAGASAQVFLADDTRLRRRVAVKVLHAGLADDESFLRRFRAEAQAAASLNHPNIVAVYDWGEDSGVPYLVSEYLAGGSLRSLLDRGVLLTPSQALLVGLEATRALEHAHRRGFVHRDIKPANLLFGEEGRLRIADFGLARALAEAAWTEPQGAVLGTARYASPEQARGEAVDGRGDIYALGLVLIEACTGSVPFATDTTIGTLMARIDRDVPVDDALGPLRRVIERAGRAAPDERPDAGEFAIGLMAAAEELPRPTPLPLAGPVNHSGPAADPTLLPPMRGEAATTAPIGDDTATIDTATAHTAPTDAALPTFADLEAVPDATPPERRRRWFRWVALLLVLAAAGVGGALAYTSLRLPSHEVPPLVGLDEEAALALIEENNWEVERREDRNDASRPGEVLTQDPAPGELLREEEPIVITVSLGRALRAVPTDLAGRTFDDAAAALEAAGLVAADPPTRRFDEDVEAGLVIALEEGTPAQLETGSAVVLVVSDGPQPRTVPAIPDGATFQVMCDALAGVQLGCTQVDVFSETVPAGQVVTTDPGPGSQAARDSDVRVQVSVGPERIAIPDVAGRSVEEATAALEAAGFQVEGVSGNPGRPVIATDPPAGERHARGTSVVLFTRR